MTPYAARRQPGFSLVELLVALAVLALLIAIMAPVFAQVAPIARRVRCAANLKNIATGYTVRQEERHLERMGAGLWAYELLPYLGHNRDTIVCPADSQTHQGLPDVLLEVTYVDSPVTVDHVPHTRPVFAVHPYWLEGSCPHPGPGIWKLNDPAYWEFITNTQSYAPSILYQYNPGEDPGTYWLVFEEGRTGGQAGSDWDYDDFRMRIVELDDGQIEVTCEKQWYYANYAFIHEDGTRTPRTEGESLGQGAHTGPYYFPYTKRLSYGINWQAAMISAAEPKILFADYEQEICNVGGASTVVDIWDEQIAPRHLGRVNIALANGGVMNVRPDEIDPTNYGGEVRDAKWWSPGE